MKLKLAKYYYNHKSMIKNLIAENVFELQPLIGLIIWLRNLFIVATENRSIDRWFLICTAVQMTSELSWLFRPYNAMKWVIPWNLEQLRIYTLTLLTFENYLREVSDIKHNLNHMITKNKLDSLRTLLARPCIAIKSYCTNIDNRDDKQKNQDITLD